MKGREEEDVKELIFNLLLFIGRPQSECIYVAAPVRCTTALAKVAKNLCKLHIKMKCIAAFIGKH